MLTQTLLDHLNNEAKNHLVWSPSDKMLPWETDTIVRSSDWPDGLSQDECHLWKAAIESSVICPLDPSFIHNVVASIRNIQVVCARSMANERRNRFFWHCENKLVATRDGLASLESCKSPDIIACLDYNFVSLAEEKTQGAEKPLIAGSMECVERINTTEIATAIDREAARWDWHNDAWRRVPFFADTEPDKIACVNSLYEVAPFEDVTYGSRSLLEFIIPGYLLQGKTPQEFIGEFEWLDKATKEPISLASREIYLRGLMSFGARTLNAKAGAVVRFRR